MVVYIYIFSGEFLTNFCWPEAPKTGCACVLCSERIWDLYRFKIQTTTAIKNLSKLPMIYFADFHEIYANFCVC